MSHEYVPAGLGQSMSAAELIKQRAQQQEAQRRQKLALQYAVGAKTPVRRTIPRPVPPRPVPMPRPKLPPKTPVLKIPPVAAIRPTVKVATVKVTGSMAAQLNIWLNRRFGEKRASMRGLQVGAKETIVPRVWYDRFRQAKARAARMAGRRTAADPTSAGAFMAWWRKCDFDGWAAWDSRITSGATATKVPRDAYTYWSTRQRVRTATNPVTGTVTGIIGTIKPAPPGAVDAQVAQVAQQGAQAQQQIATIMVPVLDLELQEDASSTPSTVWGGGGAPQMSMQGLGQITGGPSHLTQVASGNGERAQQRRARRARHAARRSMRRRHREERRTLSDAPASRRRSAVDRRRQERALQRARDIAAAKKERLARAKAIAALAKGVRKRVAGLASAAIAQRATSREVPCVSGSARAHIFGFRAPLLATPGSQAVQPQAPATSAQEAARKAHEERLTRVQRQAEHERRMAELRRKKEAAAAAAARADERGKIPGLTSTLDIEAAIKTDPAEALEQVAEAAEQATTAVEEKEELVAEIEEVVEEAKDQLEEGKTQLIDEKDLTPEMKSLQDEIDRLTGALADAKLEREAAASHAAEANQAQITLMGEEIERLKALLATSPGQATEIQGLLDAYESDIAVAQQDILDAEAALEDARTDLDETADEAQETADEIMETEPFYIRHRNVLLLGGALAIGAGYWWWKKRKTAPTANGWLRRNEGYYNLPEPKTPRRPSGL